MTYGPYPARVVDVHDGDTVGLDVDLGFGHVLTALDIRGRRWLSCRVFGINAPELSTDAGVKARDYAQTLLPIGLIVTVVSHGWDKYGGRFDGDIWLPDGTDFGQAMIDAGMAVPLT
jgi:endonuclease YncB( thermonuclease family)